MGDTAAPLKGSTIAVREPALPGGVARFQLRFAGVPPLQAPPKGIRPCLLHGGAKGAVGRDRGRRKPVSTFLEWFPYAVVGTIFTAFGFLKLYGVLNGIESGRDKPTFQYLCGT